MKKITSILILAAIAIAAITCKKTPEIPTGGNKIEIGETTTDSLSYYLAKVSTIVTATGGNEISQHGHCWSTDNEPTIEDNKTTLGKLSQPDTVFSELTELETNTKYYIRSYVTYKNGTIYSSSENIHTLEIRKPIITTSEINDITINLAYGGGTNDDGGLAVSERGICWNTLGNPTIMDQHNAIPGGVGSFTGVMLGLDENTMYHVTAYAKNSKGIGYGDEKTFSTLPLLKPEINTIEVTNITFNSVVCGGQIISTGNDDLTTHGLCWNLIGNPNLENYIDRTVVVSHDSIFTNEITNLSENTLYYIRSYATNSAGAGYGDILEFRTLESDPCGELTVDYGDKVYHTVKIGDQCWMKENLNIGARINGVENMQDNQTIEKYCYDDDEANCDTYGGLYRWDEIMQYTIDEGTQGICPDGWHVPTDNEWKILEGTVDSQYGVGDPVWDLYGNRGFDAGIQLRTTTGWSINNGTDSFGFSALPSGSSTDYGDFGYLGSGTSWFSSSLSNSTTIPIRRYTFIDVNILYRYAGNDSYSYSVRCIKD